VFTAKKVDEFLTDTLKAGGLADSDFRFSIDGGAYPKEEFVAQYRETHLDFFHRWCEREGLYYYFEHADGADGEVLVIVDSKSLHEPFPGGGRARYYPVADDDVTSGPALHHLEADVRWLPKTVTIADYNYSNPSASVRGDGSVASNGLGVIREYGYRVFDESGAKRLATVRAESIGWRETTLRARGTALGPRPGYLLGIDDAPSDVGEDWLVLEVEHEGSLSGATSEMAKLTGLRSKRTYEARLFALPKNVQYRAPQNTPWPRIYGFENALVCGDADSPYAQLDADGRYFVRFEFDTSELGDGKASTRVRMLQPHGGSSEGFHFPLRKGTEVMIAFLGGDPDRPFIAGVVPNALKPSVVGERNRSQNIVRTGSGNQLVMEDEQGKEFVYLSTPRSSTGLYMGNPHGTDSRVYSGSEGDPQATMTEPASVEANASVPSQGLAFSMWQTTFENYGLYVGGDSWANVMGIENRFIGGNASHGYASNLHVRVGGTTTEWYQGAHAITSKAGRTDTVEKCGVTQTITDKLHQTVNGDGFQHVTGAWKHDVDGENHDDYGSWKTKVAGAWTANVDGAWAMTVKGAWAGSFDDGGVTLNAAGGALNGKAKSAINLEAPSIETKSASWFDYKNLNWSGYLNAIELGALKLEEFGAVQSFKALEVGTTLVEVSVGTTRGATWGDITLAYALSKEVGATTLRQHAANIWNAAFTKL
jgi:type VI secretion system secreted protein VgrG